MKYIIIFIIFIQIFAKDVIEKDEYCTLNWTKFTLTCHAKSAPGQNEYAATKAAEVLAKTKILEKIKGVHIYSKTTINNLMTNEIVYETVEGTIRGAKIIKTQFDPSKGQAIAYAQIDLIDDILIKLLKKTEVSYWKKYLAPFLLYAAEYSQKDLDTLKKLLEDFKKSGNKKAVEFLKSILNKIKKDGKYTGIIINAKNVPNFQYALVPKIRSYNGKELYPSDYVTTDTILQTHGVVLYDSSIKSAEQNKRVTNDPIILNAKSVYGNNRSDLLLDKQSSQIIQKINDEILKKAKVIIVGNSDD